MGRLALVVVLITSAIATAQPRPEGARLFEEGRELAKAGNYPEACDRFARSMAVDRAPGTALNYGDCLEHLGQLRKAFQMFDEAARAFDESHDSRATFAHERAKAVEGKLGTVVIKIADPGLAGLIVEIAGQSVPPQGEATEKLEPGEVSIRARAPGRESFTSSARVVAGATVIVEVPVLSSTVVTPTARTAPIPEHVVRVTGGQRTPGRVRLALGVGAGGALSLAISSVVALRAKRDYDAVVASPECSKATGKLVCSSDGAAAIAGTVKDADTATGVAIVGVLLVGTAVVLYVTAPREALIVTPTATASSVGMALSGRF